VPDEPLSPYPPDPEEGAPPLDALGDAVDVAVEGADWANSRPRRLELRRVELTRVRLTGSDLGEATLADARMPIGDVLANAPVLATALGIRIVD
jgi:uncharacterized protein YjbI with pentapeptide repeats